MTAPVSKKPPYLRCIGDGVYQSDESIVKISIDEIEFLKHEALQSQKGRARICAHQDSSDLLHEMMIVINSDSYIHPHRHYGKSESFHIIEGEVDIVIFTDHGEIHDLIELGSPLTGKRFYYRLDNPQYHTLIIHSDYLAVHEVTTGPFSRDQTELAPFAPPEEDTNRVSEYMKSLRERLYTG